MPNMFRRALDDYSNRLGTFNFTSLQDHIEGRPYSFTRQQGPTRFTYWQREIGGFVQDQIRVSPNFQVGIGTTVHVVAKLNEVTQAQVQENSAHQLAHWRRIIYTSRCLGDFDGPA